MTEEPAYPRLADSGQEFILTPYMAGMAYVDEPDCIIELVQSPGTGEWIASAFVDTQYVSMRAETEEIALGFLKDYIKDWQLPERYRG